MAPAAHAAQLGAELSAARFDDTWGAEAGVTYRVGLSRIYVAPTIGAFIYKGDNDRYYTQQLSNGTEVCRDSSNGQFAKKSRCNNVAAAPYARIEVGFTFPELFTIGGGARFTTKGQEVIPYGTIAIPIAPNVNLKANAGKDYYALGLTVGY
ncbi:hypothetical protein ASE00_16320 [Sphingomonas sp. Root710]|nr:hypothetical protein ASE00_16320 [Sphingomonas sp. Root710]